MHVCTCVHISIHTLCSTIHSRLVRATLLNLGPDLINLPAPAALLLWQVSSHSHHPAVLCGSSVCWLVLCVCVRYNTFLRSGERVPSLIAHGFSHHTSYSRVLRDAPKNVHCLTSSKEVSSTCMSVLTSVCWLAHTCMCLLWERLFVFFVPLLHRLWATSNTLVCRRWACNWSWGKAAKGRGQKKVLAYAMVADDPWIDNIPLLCSLLDSHL